MTGEERFSHQFLPCRFSGIGTGPTLWLRAETVVDVGRWIREDLYEESTLIALDTNILAYAEGVSGHAMKESAIALIQKLSPAATVLPVQTLGELFHVLTRKAGRSPADARAAILSWRDTFPAIETSPAVMFAATDLATGPPVRHLGRGDRLRGRRRWVPAAAFGRYAARLTWSGVTIVNPFAPVKHAVLDAMLKGGAS